MAEEEQVQESFVEYLKDKRGRRKGLSDSSIRAYNYAAEKFLKTFPLEDDINKLENYNEFLVQFVIQKKNSMYYDAIKHFIKYAVKDTKVRTTILKNLIEKPLESNDKRKRKYLYPEERQRVIQNLKSYKHKLLAKIQLYTAARIREVITLRKGDISWEPYKALANHESTLVMRLEITSKGGKKNPIWIHDQDLAEEIDQYTLSGFTDFEYYFLERSKTRKRELLADIMTNYHWYWEDLREALSKCGYDKKDWASHDFRRNSAKDVWGATKDPLTVQRFLRHRRFDTTTRYLENAGLQNQDTGYELSKMYKND